MNVSSENEGYDILLDKHLHRKIQDKSDRATVENAIDPRTRLILYKLVRNGFMSSIHGCVSTGKEANVYFGVLGNHHPAAIKIYRTSILIFKDRDRYVQGDFRFQRYCKKNPRKMVQKWAEKEARNLRRLEDANIPAPRVLHLKHNILVMSFLGKDGWPFPRMQDVGELKYTCGRKLFLRTVDILRKLYLECNLIHGDFSEYNLLVNASVNNGDESIEFESDFEIYVIDVSQSVEPDHPNAMEFLRRDIANIHFYFADAMSSEVRYSHEKIFLYVTGCISSLDELSEEKTGLHEVPDDVFRQIPIPFTLARYTGPHDSSDVERHYNLLKSKRTGVKHTEEIDRSEELCTQLNQMSVGTASGRKSASNLQYTVSCASKEERKEHRKLVKMEKQERRRQKKTLKGKMKK